MHKITKKRVVLIRAMEDTILDIPKLGKEISAAEVEALKIIVKKIRKDDMGHYLSLGGENGQINVSYCKDAAMRFELNRRIMTSIGRYFSKNYSEEYAKLRDVTVDLFVRRISVNINKASALMLDSEIKQYRGKEIINYYRDVAEKESHSCMTGKCKSYVLNVYEANPDKVSLVVLSNTIRAFLWTCDDGTKILDRAYPSGHAKIDLLRLWAETKGYVLRKNADQNIVDNTIELSDGSKRQIVLKHSGVFPFMDTFRYGSFNGNLLTVSNDYEFGEVKFNVDQGTYTEVIRCYKCGDKRAKQREVMVNGSVEYITICDACYTNMFFACSHCGKNMSVRNRAVDAEKNRRGRAFCKKCVNNFQQFVRFNACSCDRCAQGRKDFGAILKEAGIDPSKELDMDLFTKQINQQ